MDLSESPLEGARRHPWERTRARFFVDRVTALLDRGGLVLDLGAGDAFFASELARRCPKAAITCCDLGYDAATIARLSHLYPSLTFAREPSGRFDLAIALDVAEHVDDDHGFVSGIVRERLSDRGHLLFSVPAYAWLWSSHDVALRHHRRYAHGQARALLEGAGLDVVEGGGLFGSLVAPRAVAVGLEKLRGTTVKDASEGAIAWDRPAWLTSIVMGALAIDARVSHRAARSDVDLPGLSYWALAQKRGRS
jgi:hypothetical protein